MTPRLLGKMAKIWYHRKYPKNGENKTPKSGLTKKLWIAWCKAEAGMIFKVSQTVIQRATEMEITKIQETEKIDRDGNPYTEIKTVKTGPDAYLALKILEKFDPEWGRFEDEPSADTDTRTDTGDTSRDGKDPLEAQIERMHEAFEGWAQGNPDTE